MCKYEDQVLDFQENKRHNLPEEDRNNLCIKITTNGEICFDAVNKEYIVFEETYAYEVGRTSYPKVATNMLKVYSEEYL